MLYSLLSAKEVLKIGLGSVFGPRSTDDALSSLTGLIKGIEKTLLSAEKDKKALGAIDMQFNRINE